MILSILHGLGVRRNPILATDTYNRLIANAHTAPLGKSYGSYTLDTVSAMAIVKTINLPDVSGYLKQTQIDFLIERLNTINGDFIIATAQPMFPANLGSPIISEHYINALRGRKFITYQNGTDWSAWKEIGNCNNYLADFRALTNATYQLYIDPSTVREYFVHVEANATVKISIDETEKFTTSVFLDFAPESSINTLQWPLSSITWTNANGLAPTNIEVGFRLRVELKKSEDDLLFGTYFFYKAT